MLGKGLESLIPPNRGQGQPAQPQGMTQPAQPAAQPIAQQSQPVAQPQPTQQPAVPPDDQEIRLPGAHLEPARELEPAAAPIEIAAPAEEPELEAPQAWQQPQALPTEEHAEHEPAPTAALTHVELDPQEVAAQYGGKPQKHRSESIFYLETDQIRPNPNQPRKHFDEEALRELAASIREYGILQPLTVTKIEHEVPDGTKVEYEIIAGERRWQAARIAGLERVPAIIRTVDMARERLELAVIENIQRENLSPIELARSFARLQDEFRLTQREIATRLGKSREVVANTLRLLDLPGYIQEALEKGQVSESHGRLLLAIEDPAAQQALFHDLLNQHLTTRELRRRTAFLKAKSRGATDAAAIAAGVGSDASSPEIKQFEERLASELGAPVSIKTTGASGKITIEFYSPEELAQIVQKLAEGESAF